MRDFFITYHRADEAWAKWIGQVLENAGYSILAQPQNFSPGSNFILEMQRAATATRFTLLVLSPDVLKSKFAAVEWAAAFERDAEGQQRTLFPVRVREGEPPELPGQVVYIDLVGLSEEGARRALLEAAAENSARSSEPVIFPSSSPSSDSFSKTTAVEFPRKLPRVWHNVPRRNHHFTGREDLLDELEKNLTIAKGTQSVALTQELALKGLGGMGKTQLVTEYLYRHLHCYDVVVWLRAENASTLAEDVGTLAQALGLVPASGALEGRDLDAAIQAVKAWCSKNGRWIFVFDNVEDREVLEPYLPLGGQGHVLITSRLANAWGHVQELELSKLARENSIRFLLERTGEEDRAAADRLAHQLGDLPLALEQAAAFMRTTGRGMEQYLALYQERGEALRTRGQALEYPETVATTWTLAFEQLEKESPAGAVLLKLCAFLASDDIPQELIVGGAEHLPEPLASTAVDELAFAGAVKAATRSSLLSARPEAFAMHRVVRAITRDRLSEEEAGKWVGAAVQVVASAFSYLEEDPDTWSGSARLLPHALTATRQAERLGIELEVVAGLLNRLGLYLQSRGELGLAREQLERSLVVTEQVHGLEHPTVAAAANNLGMILQDLGDLPGAREQVERALAINETFYGPEHPVVAAGANNLGMILRELGDLAGAREQVERALAISETLYGPEHPEVAMRANNLGMILQDLGDLAGAREQVERALAINEFVYGPEHPVVAASANNLGMILRELGDLTGAREQVERALMIVGAIYGLKHPVVATRANNLGMILRDLGDLAGAREQIERELSINESVYGPEHPLVAASANNLGMILRELGDLTGARERVERALSIDENVYGPEHPIVATRANNLGMILRDLGDLPEAREQLERALAIDEKVYGPEHPNTQTARNNLAVIAAESHDHV